MVAVTPRLPRQRVLRARHPRAVELLRAVAMADASADGPAVPHRRGQP